MKATSSGREKMKVFLTIMTPILLTQLGMYMMNFIDTVMSGRASPKDLAGVAVGTSLWFPVFTCLSGILMSLTPVISENIGAKRNKDISFSLIQGLYLSIGLSLGIFTIGVLFLDLVLQMMPLQNEVRAVSKGYLTGLSSGIVPLFMYTALRSFIDSHGKTHITMTIIFLAVPINMLLNYLFIYGRFGIPALGGAGTGYASGITYWFLFLSAFFYIAKGKAFSGYHLFKSFPGISLSKWKELLGLGVPIGVTMFLESSIFSVVTILMSRYDTDTIAAHQAAANFAYLFYMLPLSIALTLTICVSHEVGAGRREEAKKYSYLGMMMAFGLGLLSCLFIFYLRTPVSYLYTNSPSVALLIQKFLVFSIFFQLSDALATPIQGVLRGYKDVKMTFIIALISFWIIGIPTGSLLAVFTKLEAFGYWIGLISALASMAAALFIRLQWLQRKSQLGEKQS
ncbi:MATE family efflux transporter [Domibacillus indicus]|uniref:MATE family efflux transporter n=1 Tax=Domibacillus indicus TaxID=1437523 RepID=UPI00203CBA02|nr:MATE family efflux transporter [Domibacillus indicus]MCM3789313.1 MATE family efflux transporter [Domibacillus indicus]